MFKKIYRCTIAKINISLIIFSILGIIIAYCNSNNPISFNVMEAFTKAKDVVSQCN